MAPTPSDAAPATLHTVFTSECHNPQFDWFATGVYRSHRESGIRGRITRLLACGADDLAQYRGLGLGPTFVHPNYRHNPLNGDTSASYNKPGSVMHFSREANFTEEYVLFIDADMLLVRDIDPVALGARRGVVVSERVSYMIGTSNAMAANFLPPDRVALAKPVGWYHIFHRDDLKRIAPLWLEFCGKVRTNPQLYWSMNGSIPRDIPTGDAYVHHGEAPWISEMYGYAFGAAMAGVDHVITSGVVEYPSSVRPTQEPYIIHYGIDFNIGPSYNWNKMVYKSLDLYKCKGRFFGPPPKPRNKAERFGAFVVNTLNDAFCDFYRTQCAGAGPAVEAADCPPHEAPPPSKARCDGPSCCDDRHANCWAWALGDECENNPAFMRTTCPKACGACKGGPAAADAVPLLPTADHALPAPPPSPPPLQHQALHDDTDGAAEKMAAAAAAEKAAISAAAAAAAADAGGMAVGAWANVSSAARRPAAIAVDDIPTAQPATAAVHTLQHVAPAIAPKPVARGVRPVASKPAVGVAPVVSGIGGAGAAPGAPRGRGGRGRGGGRGGRGGGRGAAGAAAGVEEDMAGGGDPSHTGGQVADVAIHRGMGDHMVAGVLVLWAGAMLLGVALFCRGRIPGCRQVKRRVQVRSSLLSRY
jgi:hypothetical protein